MDSFGRSVTTKYRSIYEKTARESQERNFDLKFGGVQFSSPSLSSHSLPAVPRLLLQKYTEEVNTVSVQVESHTIHTMTHYWVLKSGWVQLYSNPIDIKCHK